MFVNYGVKEGRERGSEGWSGWKGVKERESDEAVSLRRRRESG